MPEAATLPATANPGGTAMPLYSGTKELRAIPMTRGIYNAYRGWTPPEGEDQSVDGYLVEYTDGGEPNDDRHTGYISWSPKDVFERAYKPIDSYVDRMEIERSELNQRAVKLSDFIHVGDAFGNLPPLSRSLLLAQLDAMNAYLKILSVRLSLAKDQPPSSAQ